jgi:hypothetical protein
VCSKQYHPPDARPVSAAPRVIAGPRAHAHDAQRHIRVPAIGSQGVGTLDAYVSDNTQGSTAMYDSTESTEHQAVTRLFDLVRAGEVDNLEFTQLDSLVYGRLLQAYDAETTTMGESIS